MNEVAHRGKKRGEGVRKEGPSALDPARGAQADEASQNDAEVERGDVDLVALEDVGTAPQMNPSHPSSLADVSETSLDGLAAATEEAFADGAPDPAAVEVQSPLSFSGFSLAVSPGKPL